MSGPDDALVVFTPSGKRGRFPLGTPLLAAARELGVDIDSICGGRGLCGRCQVVPTEGEFAKHGIRSRLEHLSACNAVEQRFAQRRGLAAERRLSCQARVAGDLVIDVPADSQVHHQLVRKAHEARSIELDPVLRLHLVEVPRPDIRAQRGDLQRLLEALRAQWALAELDCGLVALRTLQAALREGGWQVTVAVREGREIVAVWPGFRDRVYGVAVDIGSTTIAAHLCELGSGEVVASAGRMNPQIRFGEDLMSRVSYVMQNPGGEATLSGAVREALGELIGEVAERAGIEPAEILELTVVGNPVMHHLFLGFDPRPLGVAPFALATDAPVSIAARELGLTIHPGGRVYVLPCIAGHVGADSAAVILAEAPYRDERISLIVDVGTNAEIVLGNCERLLAASSPTGPAFEGAQISCGQRAAAGAIERVRIDRVTLEPRFKLIGCELWSDEPGFAEAVKRTGINGVCGSGIIEAIAEMYLAGLIDEDGVISGELAARSSRVLADGRTFSYLLHDGEPRLLIRQTDVRAIQLAKAALYAGARLLMEHFGTDKVDRIRLAGAFGSFIDVKYAMLLGMIPDCDLSQVSAAGNAAGTGARIALLNAAARRDIEARVRSVEKIETAVEPNFQRHFVAAMALPHKTDPFPNLAKVLDLPPRKAPALRVRRRRR